MRCDPLLQRENVWENVYNRFDHGRPEKNVVLVRDECPQTGICGLCGPQKAQYTSDSIVRATDRKNRPAASLLAVGEFEK
jgi:hypothetical protein